MLAVQGAGTTRHGSAAVAALSGYDVRLRDITAEVVQHGHE
ncbi:3-hydroxyacyl-CoA dehydrogenase NAD-binding domain-containing protein [Halorhabdus utahensis]